MEYKVAFCGDFGVGKTCLMTRYTTGEYNPQTVATIGASFQYKWLKDQKIRIGLWDTAGQERFSSLLPLYYRNAHAIIYCISWDTPLDVDKINKFIVEVRGYNTTGRIFFVVTKRDLCNDKIAYAQELEHFARDLDISVHYTSAYKNIGITEFFDELVEYLKKCEVPEKEITIEYVPSKNCCWS